MKLTDEEFNFLKLELENTPIMTDDDMSYIKSAHPLLYNASKNFKTEFTTIFTENCLIYNLQNEKLNEFLCDKFEEPIENLYEMHRLIYGIGGFSKRHRDQSTTHKTISIVLSDDFTGGDMYLNDKFVSLNKCGEYVKFNGGKDFHEIKEITSGNREVLIVWFSKNKSKTTLI
jgi:hypothetical protein